jgi:AraC-like DNA-binding protein
MTVVQKKLYTIVAMYRQSFDTIASFGFDKQKMYEEVGLNLDKLPAEYHLDPKAHSDKFWRVLTKYIPEDEITFRIMERFSMGVFGVSGYVIVNSPNFIKAFENFVRYTNLHTNMYKLRLEQNQHVELIFERTVPLMYSDKFNLEMYVLGFTLNILKLLPGKQLPLEVHYEFTQPRNMKCYEELFGANTKFFFNTTQNKMVYDRVLTNIPLLNANEQLYQMFDQMATDSLQQKMGEGSVSRLVKEELSKRIKGYLPTVDEIAQHLNMSSRTLQLKLKNENASFRELADEVRKDIAIAHLKAQALNISEIAYLLGFSEISSFSTAFKKWTGTSPSAFA